MHLANLSPSDLPLKNNHSWRFDDRAMSYKDGVLKILRPVGRQTIEIKVSPDLEIVTGIRYYMDQGKMFLESEF